jgi:hypothetical protein
MIYYAFPASMEESFLLQHQAGLGIEHQGPWQQFNKGQLDYADVETS